MVMYTLVILVEVVLVVHLLSVLLHHALVVVAVVITKTVEVEALVPVDREDLVEEPVDNIVMAVVIKAEEVP